MVHKRLRGPYLAVVFAALFAVAALLLSTSRVVAAAATSCSWASQTSITCSGETFTQSSTSGSTMTLSGDAVNTGCADTDIDSLVVDNYQTASSGNLTTYDSNCNATTSSAALSGTFSQESSTCSDGSTPVNGSCPAQNEASCGGGAFDWAICPSDTIFEQWAQDLLNFMEGLMTINTTGSNGIFGNGATSTAYYQAWNTFRILAIGLIVIAGLVMVAAQAYGLEILDAYTIRKILPRLLVAIIGISLSWPLMSFVINFFNDFGRDVQNLMYAPFSTLPDHSQLTGGIAKWGFVGVIATLLALKLGGPILMILGIGALDLFTAVLVLVIRQVAVVVLVISAPIAIAAYVLPNTKKIWDFWRDNFLGLMFMFPIITMLMAAGEIFGAVGKNGSTIQQIIGIVAFFVPYFMIPFAFRMATGIISNISGFMHDRRKTLRGRMRAGAGAMAGKRWQDIRGFNAYKGGVEGEHGNFRGNFLNKRLGQLANINQAGMNPFKMRSQMQAFESRHSFNAAAKFREENEAFKMFAGNDDFLNSMLKSHGNEQKLRDSLRSWKAADGVSQRYDNATIDQVVAQSRVARRNVADDVFEKAAALGIAASGTGDAVVVENGKIVSGGAGEQNKRINEIWGNDRVGAVTALVAARSLNSGARRFDISGGSTSEAINTLNFQYNGGNSGGMSVADATIKTVKESLEGQGGSYVAGSRKPAVKAFAPIMLDNLRQKLKPDANGNINEDILARELAKLAGRYDAMAQVSPENADILADQVMGQVLSTNPAFAKRDERGQPTGKYMTVRETIESFRGRTDKKAAEFHNMRREYGVATRQGATDADSAAMRGNMDYARQVDYARQMEALGQQQGPIGPVQPPPFNPLG
jgi:hypothetical protein